MKLSTFFTLILLTVNVSSFSINIGASIQQRAPENKSTKSSNPTTSNSSSPTEPTTGRKSSQGRNYMSRLSSEAQSNGEKPLTAEEENYNLTAGLAPKDPPTQTASPPAAKGNRSLKSSTQTLPAQKIDPRLLVIAVYFLLQFDSIKEITFDVSDKLRLYRVRDVLQRFIPSWIINHPSRGMIFALFAGAVGTYTCSRYYSWKTETGSYDWINIILSGVAGHFSYSSIKTIFMRPEYATSFYRWVEELGQTHAQRKNYPPIIPTKR